MIRRRLLASWPLALVFALAIWLFRRVLFADEVFCFRDGAHFYFPLLRQVAEQWRGGMLPLWNPVENLGAPLAASGTTAAFYPFTAIFHLPGLPYRHAYAGYVVGHLLLAAVASYGLARRARLSRESSAVAAMVYAFSGHVLYQYLNVIFLVGAAWLPLQLLAADRMFGAGDTRTRLGAAVLLSLTLAMPVLGGDPQAAYHGLLLAALLGLTTGNAPPETGASPRASEHSWRRRLAWLGASAALAGALSAVQVLPTMQLAADSQRTLASVPTSLWQTPPFLARGETDAIATGLLCRDLATGSHRQTIYHFSVGPWRLVELLWPNISGRQFPQHHRWLAALPAEGRIWVPSLYLGVIPLLLAAVGVLAPLRTRGQRRLKPLALVMAILGVAGATGWFAGAYYFHAAEATIFGTDHVRSWFGAPVGGLYWLLCVALPGYASFRYPAKLWTLAILGIALVAAIGWEAAVRGRGSTSRAQLRGMTRWLAVASALLTVVALLVPRSLWDMLATVVPADPLFGPLVPSGVRLDVTMGLAQAAVVACAAWMLLRCSPASRRFVPLLLMLLVAADLAVAHRWLVVSLPVSRWKTEPLAASLIDTHRPPSNQAAPLPRRVYRRATWCAGPFRETTSPDRFAEALQWDRDTLYPKYHVGYDVELAEVRGTMLKADYDMVLGSLRSTTSYEPGDSGRRYPGHWFRALACEAVILRGTEGVDGGGYRQVLWGEQDAPADASLWIAQDVPPRAWIAHRVRRMPPLAMENHETLRARTREVFERLTSDPDGASRQAVVEADSLPPWLTDPNRDASAPADSAVRIEAYAPREVVLSAQLSRPALVVLADQYAPGWRLDVSRSDDGTSSPWQPAPILRTNRVLRGAALPAGSWRLRYRYEPSSFRVGAVLSVATWAAVLVVGATLLVCRPRRKLPHA